MFVWLLAVGIVMAGHLAFEAACQCAKHHHLEIDLSPLDLTQPDNVSNYTICVTLLIAATYGVLVLSLRRHKIDDYRGRYRLWYYVCVALFSVSLMIGGNLTRTAHSTIVYAATLSGVAPQPEWLVSGSYGLGLLAGIRLWIEIRSSRAASLCLIAAGLIAAYRAAIPLNLVDLPGPEFAQLAKSLTQLSAVQLLLLSIVFYARYVYLDAQGWVTHKVRRPSGAKRSARQARGDSKAEPDTDSKSPIREEPVGSDRTSKSRRMPTRSAEDEDTSEIEPSDSSAEQDTIQLTRAERRRLRKKKGQQRRAA